MHKSTALRALEDVVSTIQKNKSDLFCFAFELRKQDTEDKYSFDFLNGQVKPAILVDIIMSNQWVSEKDQMIVNQNFFMNVDSYFLIYQEKEKKLKLSK